MKILENILETLSTPDSQNRDWYGWVTNQCSHVLMGIIVGMFFPGAVIQMILIIALMIEMVDLFRVPTAATLKDSIIDITFWVLGGILYMFQDTPLIGICLISAGLLIGILPRLRKVLSN